jgi:hypothetical protein
MPHDLAALVAGLAVTALGAAAVLLLTRRRPAPPPADWPPAPSPRLAAGERRLLLRRRGAAVPLLVIADAWARPVDGWVIDRSLTGLRIAVGAPVEPGWMLEAGVRDPKKGDLRAFRLEVVHCRPDGRVWEAGCRFAEAPPVEVMLLLE